MMRAYLSGGAALALTLASGAVAAPVYYQGGDSVTTYAQMTNAQAASAQFDAAVPGTTLVTFESAAPAGFGWSHGSVTSTTLVTGCQHRCGFNTTVGGGNYLEFGSGTITFTFASAINSFGAYVTGLQNTLVGGPVILSFNDGSAQSVALTPVEGGGGAFIGFTTPGAVTSLSFYTRSDIVGFDDIRFGFTNANAAVPEPTTWAMMIAGFGLTGAMMRRRQRTAAALRFA